MTTATPPRPADLSPRAQAIFPDPEYGQLIDAARSHPAIFLDVFGSIFDAPSNRAMRFQLWDWQWSALNYMLQHKRVIILKARQLGMSWLAAGYALWVALTKPNSVILLVSRTEGVASTLLSKCSYIYNRLPAELKSPNPSRRDKDNTTEMYFAAFNSKILAVASTRESGRSESSTLVIADEWADHPEAAEMYSSYEPTTGTEGQIIGLSTAKGRSGFFYKLYSEAKRGMNDFLPLFLGAHLRPDYTDEFLAAKHRTYEMAGEEWMFYREYPSKDLDAFQGSLDLFFPADALQRLSNGVRPPVKLLWDNNFRIWETPRRGQRYTIGVDPARGGADSSVGFVMDARATRHVATLRSNRWSPYQFAELLHRLGTEFYCSDPNAPESAAIMAVERNAGGLAVIEALSQVWSYPNLARFKPRKKGAAWHTGWDTNSATRPLLLADLSAAVADESFYTQDEEWLDEAFTFERDELGRPSASSTNHDDHITASGVCLQARNQYPVVRGVRQTTPLSR